MLELSNLNPIAIIVAWVISIALGSFWYSPAGFGKLWSKLSGVDIMKRAYILYRPKSLNLLALIYISSST